MATLENSSSGVEPDNATVHQQNSLPTVADDSTMKVEPVVPSPGAELRETNRDLGFDSTPPTGAPPLVNVPLSGADEEGNSVAAMPLDTEDHDDDDDNEDGAEEDDDIADEDDDGGDVEELKGNKTRMLGFSGFPKRKAQDSELKKYLSQFGVVLHCKIRRKNGKKGPSTGVADVRFRDMAAEESALKAQHVFRDRPCSLTREASRKEEERLHQRRESGPRDNSQDKVICIAGLPKGSKTEDVEKLLAGYAGVKEVFVNKKGWNAYVDFETPFYALQLLKNKPHVEGRRPLRIKFAKRGWRPGNN